jgi:hypothetical protein
MRPRGVLGATTAFVLLVGPVGCRGDGTRTAQVDEREARQPETTASASLASTGAASALLATASAALPEASAARADGGGEPDRENRSKPSLTTADLTERSQHLFEAIVKNEPSRADDFFFPKGPFLPLKDVADPGRYYDQLLATYHRDIASLHAKRKDWAGATFVSFELGTPPGWVAPGKEYNKIGYFRTFHGKLRYRVAESVSEIEVTTIISWDNRWYVTHLMPIQH